MAIFYLTRIQTCEKRVENSLLQGSTSFPLATFQAQKLTWLLSPPHLLGLLVEKTPFIPSIDHLEKLSSSTQSKTGVIFNKIT